MSLALHFSFWLLAAPPARANPIVSAIVGALVIAAIVALYFEMNGDR